MNDADADGGPERAGTDLNGNGLASRARAPVAERCAMLLPRVVPPRWRQPLKAGALALQRLVFDTGQRLGLHVTVNSFSSPVPDTRTLPDTCWSHDRTLPAIDLREQAQVELLRASARYITDVESLSDQGRGPFAYHLENPKFGTVDAHVAFALVRQHRPRQIVEVGSGWSTQLFLAALDANAAEGSHGRLQACEPYPDQGVRAAARQGRIALAARPVQTLPLRVFTDLSAGDVVFIDSSHVVKIGSDVRYLVLEVLPRLQPGVLVHFHDVFMPLEYPRDWVVQRQRFYNEQYLLEAFLSFNPAYEVVWASSYLHVRRPDLLEATIGSYSRERHHPGSLWIRRTGASAPFLVETAAARDA